MVQVQLDRAFCSSGRFDSWSAISCTSPLRHSSNHNPLLLGCMSEDSRPSFFRFRVMWTTYKDFLSFVKDEWSRFLVYGPPMKIMMSRLKHLQSALRILNFLVFGDLNREIEDYSNMLEPIQLGMD